METPTKEQRDERKLSDISEATFFRMYNNLINLFMEVYESLYDKLGELEMLSLEINRLENRLERKSNLKKRGIKNKKK